MVRIILAKYHVFDGFKIPKNIPLLSVEENNKVNPLDNIPYSWYVRWGTLYYYDDKNKVCEIECYWSSEDDSKKHPDGYESDVEDSDSEDDSEDKSDQEEI